MRREEILDRVRAGETWDLIVIGGGATGLGTAVDAAARGYRTLLLDAYDFAKGTSSRSTKLIHGGVRYLAQGNVSLVRESLHERELLLRNAPHLVHDLGFVIPAYDWFSLAYYGLGLTLYDLLAGRLGLGKSRGISRAEVIERVPTLEADGLRGGILYHDGQFDDARLAIALARTLIDQGGTALNHASVVALLKAGGRVAGVQARDAETGEEYSLRARAVVNATGVFADTIRQLDDPRARPMLQPSQGIHLVLDHEFLPGSSAIMIPHTDDGRVVFAIPWQGRTLLGTTDTPVDRVEIEPRPLLREVEFLLKHARRYLTRKPEPRDVLSAFAGLRPLIGSGDRSETSQLSREHAVLVSGSGLITITGGKWTTYRRMGETAVDHAIKVAALPRRDSTTSTLRLHGCPSERGDNLDSVYGSDRSNVDLLCSESPGGNERLHPRLPYRAGEVVWAARYEFARTVEDVLARRTRALFLDARASGEAAPRVAEVLARELGRDLAWQEEQVRHYRELARGYVLDDLFQASHQE